MCTWAELRDLVATLPGLEIIEGNKTVIRRGNHDLAWRRPLSKKDLAALGDAAPSGEVLAVHVNDLFEKEAWLSAEPRVLFTTPHFANYPAVLVRLDVAPVQLLRELLDS